MTISHPFRRILHVLHPDLISSPAMVRTVALGKAVRAEIWLALYDVGPRLGLLAVADRDQAATLEKSMREQRSKRLAELARKVANDTGLTVHVIDETVPLEASRIVKAVVLHDIDLVVKDAGHIKLLRRLLTLPVDWDLLRTCPARVWLVAAGHDTLRTRVAAAVDPLDPEHGAGRLNEAIVETARALANAAEEEWRVVSVITNVLSVSAPFTGVDPLVTPTFEALRARHQDDFRAAFASLLERHGLTPSRGELLFGDPGDALIDEVAEEHTDILVVGVVRRRGLDRMLMGSTAEHLVARAPCDILAVPNPVPVVSG